MKKAMWSAAAALVLVATSVFTAAPAMAAGTCQALPITTQTSTTITAKNPCGNLSAKYDFWWSNPDGTTGSVTRTVVPLGSTAFSIVGHSSWSLSVK